MDTTPSSNRPRGRVVFHSAREYRVLSGAVALCIGLLLLDQATKLLVERYFTLGRSLEIVPGFFSLTYVTNRGAAWGILTGHGWLLLLIAVVVAAAMLYFLRHLTEGWPERYYALFVVLSGVLGNSIDRIWRHAVVDFFDFYLANYHWPVFNIADCAITVGIAVYLISVLLRPAKKSAGEASPAVAEHDEGA